MLIFGISCRENRNVYPLTFPRRETRLSSIFIPQIPSNPVRSLVYYERLAEQNFFILEEPLSICQMKIIWVNSWKEDYEIMKHRGGGMVWWFRDRLVRETSQVQTPLRRSKNLRDFVPYFIIPIPLFAGKNCRTYKINEIRIFAPKPCNTHQHFVQHSAQNWEVAWPIFCQR